MPLMSLMKRRGNLPAGKSKAICFPPPERSLHVLWHHVNPPFPLVLSCVSPERPSVSQKQATNLEFALVQTVRSGIEMVKIVFVKCYRQSKRGGGSAAIIRHRRHK